MDSELKVLRSFTTRLPGFPGAGLIANWLSEFYGRKKREPVECELFDLKLRLNPAEAVERGMLFFPQLFDRHERAFLKRHLKPGCVFLDVGSNVGFYSLIASQMVGMEGKVIAFEADPETFASLEWHVSANDLKNITCVNIGVSDRIETLQLTRKRDGNRGGNSFLTTGEESVPVKCEPLANLLSTMGIHKVDALKIDIEGMEYRVLLHFFDHACWNLWPKVMVVEDNPAFRDSKEGTLLTLLLGKGYLVAGRAGLNLLLYLV